MDKKQLWIILGIIIMGIFLILISTNKEVLFSPKIGKTNSTCNPFCPPENPTLLINRCRLNIICGDYAVCGNIDCTFTNQTICRLANYTRIQCGSNGTY